MPFDSRVFQLAKDPENPGQYEDAWRLDAQRAVAAVADGVSASMFSGPWATLLTAAAVADAPDTTDHAALVAWLAPLRQAWAAGIDTAQLTWFQKAKLKQGAFSTLLWASLEPRADEGRPLPGEYRLRGWAIGDSCLFLVREGRLLRSFPLQTVEQFQADPLVIGSLDLGRDDRLAFSAFDEPCREGDLVVLCTDAIAAWSLGQIQPEGPSPWERFWSLSEDAWREEMLALRAREELRYDDTTVLLLRVAADVPAGAKPPGAAAGEPSSVSSGATAGLPSSVEQTSGGAPPSDDELSPVASAPCAATGPAGQASSGTRATVTAGQAGVDSPTTESDDIYALAAEPAAAPGPSGPPPLPERAPPHAESPPLPTAAPPLPEWAKAVNATAEQITQQVSEATDQVLWGMKQLREAALRKYREKFPPRDP
jgi:hypothetical protein